MPSLQPDNKIENAQDDQDGACETKQPIVTSSNSSTIAAPPTSISPSRFQVTSDLIDATCHDILLLRGNSELSNDVPYTSYELHAKSLQHYMEQFSSLEGEGEQQPVLNDLVRTRFSIAQLAIGTCGRIAYSDGDDESLPLDMPPLIQLSPTEWKEKRERLVNLHAKMKSMGGENVNDMMESSLESLNCQMEAFEILAQLRNELVAVETTINENNAKKGKKKKKLTVSQFSHVGQSLEEYKQMSIIIEGKMENIHQTSHADLFIPQEMLVMKRCTTVQRVKTTVSSLIKGIDDMISNKAFPLAAFQQQFLKLLQNWEKTLETPTLFKIGYFKDLTGQAKKSSTKSKSAASKTALKDEVNFDSDDDVIRVKRNKKGSKKRAPHQKKKALHIYDSDSDDSDDSTPPLVQQKKKQKRIPYSKEEKDTLLMGVERFGKGEWIKIRSYYNEVFSVNNRSNVNLKDLYRTLTKDA